MPSINDTKNHTSALFWYFARKKSPGSSFKGAWPLLIQASYWLQYCPWLKSYPTHSGNIALSTIQAPAMITFGEEKVNVCPSTVKRQSHTAFAHAYYTRNSEAHPLPQCSRDKVYSPKFFSDAVWDNCSGFEDSHNSHSLLLLISVLVCQTMVLTYILFIVVSILVSD